MKIKKLNLNDLKVESFVTSLESKNVQTIKGAGSETTTIPLVSVSLAISISVAITYYAGCLTNAKPTEPVENTVCCSYLQGCINSYNPGCV